MTIKHLVISGGGPTAITSLGAIQQLEKNNFWKYDDIESIYATSSGVLLGTIICLKFMDWDIINNYIINRPWHEAFPINAEQIINSYLTKGIFDKNAIEIFFKPLFHSKDLSINMTLKDLYDYSKINFHIFTTELNSFETIDISHLSHPTLSLLDAVHMSCAIPIIFSPVCIDDKCYIDGGVTTNYPLIYCIEKYLNENEILSFKNDYSDNVQSFVNKESNILEYISIFFSKLMKNISNKCNQKNIENQVIYKTKYLTLDFLNDALKSNVIRTELFDIGVKSADDFLKNRI